MPAARFAPPEPQDVRNPPESPEIISRAQLLPQMPGIEQEVWQEGPELEVLPQVPQFPLTQESRQGPG